MGKSPSYFVYRIVLILVLLSCFHTGLNSQHYFQIDQRKADSLERELLSSEGKEKVDILNELSYIYTWRKKERSQLLNDEALELAMELDYKYGIGRAYLVSGNRLFTYGKSVEASHKLFDALEIFEELADSNEIAVTNLAIASNFFFGKKNVEGVYEYGLRSLRYYESVRDLDEMARIYIIFAGIVTNVFHRPAEGLEWAQKFLAINDSVDIPNIERGIGVAIAGDANHEQGNLRAAIDYYHEARKIYDENIIEERAVKAQNTSALGMYYKEFGMPDSALYWFDESIKLSESITYLYGMISANIRIGDYYASIGNYEKAILAYEQAIPPAIKMSNTGSFYEKPEYRDLSGWSYEIYQPLSKDFKKRRGHNWLIEAYHGLSESFNELGEHAKALQAYKMEIAYADSSYMYDTERNLDELKAQFETERKDQQILLLSQENELKELKVKQRRNLLVGLGGLIILILGAAYILVRQNKLRSEQHTAVLEQKLLRSQMNPHFLFNAISNISNLIDKNDNETASRFLTKFSRLVRHILESTRIDFIELEEEINNIENYLALQKLRFENKLEYKIKVDEEIDPAELAIPSMLVQPFVENAIVHGLKPKEGPGHLDIIFRKRNGSLECLIDDDGVGRDKARELEGKEQKSGATSITRQRLDILNRKLKKKVTLEISDMKTEMGISLGTRVKITIPIE